MDDLALDMLPERDAALWEEHLLICSTCQDRLAETDEYICLMKSAATAQAQAPGCSPLRKPMMAALTHAAAFGVTFWPR